jgi:hypothetical protein
VGKPEGSRPLGRLRYRWVDLGELEWGDVDWIGLSQDRNRWRALVDSVLNLRVPSILGNYRVALQLVASGVVLSST